MSFKRSLENLFRGPQAVLPMTRSKDDPAQAVPVTPDNPLPVTVVGGSTGGGGTVQADPESAREATQQQILTHMQAANGNSYALANQALNEGLHVRPAPTLVPLSRQTLTLTAAAQGLTVPTGATAARISVRGGNASVAVTVPAPTATEGDLWPDGSMWELGQDELAGFRAVIASGSPVLQVTYLGVGA